MNSMFGFKKKNKILHVVYHEKFIPDFIDFLEKHFIDFDRNQFFIFGDIDKFPMRMRPNIIVASSLNKASRLLQLAFLMNSAEKIVFHGFFVSRAIQLLALQPWLFGKTYWIIWGGDLYKKYFPKKIFKNFIHSFVAKRVGHLVTSIKEEYEYAVEYFGARGMYHECFSYPSNIYNPICFQKRISQTINIQVGNSATETNEHIKIFEKLSKYKNKDIKLYVPLSYGDEEYAKKVIELGEHIFRNKFIPILEFLPLHEYKKILSEIDIAVFGNNRQQGFGNIITLLGMGKKVYMRNDVTSWEFLKGLGVSIFDIDYFDISILPYTQEVENKRIISEYFSESSLIRQLKSVLSLNDLRRVKINSRQTDNYL